MKKVSIFASLVATLLISAPAVAIDYTYSLEDINPASATFGQQVSPQDYSGQVTLHYFGFQC